MKSIILIQQYVHGEQWSEEFEIRTTDGKLIQFPEEYSPGELRDWREERGAELVPLPPGEPYWEHGNRYEIVGPPNLLIEIMLTWVEGK